MAQTPFRPQLFLFRMLAAVFAIEAVLLIYSFERCTKGVPVGVPLTERCPRLGQRTENIFEIAIATTLSLLAGSTVVSQRKKPSVSAPASPLPSSLQPQAQEKVRESAQESVRVLGQAQRSEKES